MLQPTSELSLGQICAHSQEDAEKFLKFLLDNYFRQDFQNFKKKKKNIVISTIKRRNFRMIQIMIDIRLKDI